jgi:hypothetical protein
MAIDHCPTCDERFDRDHHTECPRCGPAIVTHYDPKPIPTRKFDWCAVFEGYDGGDPIGFGETEEAAVADLKMEVDA